MAGPSSTVDQNLLPVQAYFDVYGNFQTFIGQGQPFYASINPSQSGLNITNSTINNTTIGATTPSTGVFTNVLTTTGQVNTTPSGNTDITNKFYVDTVAQGLGPKAACKCATLTNITLSGLQTIDGYTTLAGDRVLVKNQGSSQYNGIYNASASAWTRATDMDVWSEVPGAYTVVLNGSQANTAWVSTSADTGTINVTPITWVLFSGVSTYTAGTGLTLVANQFSITNTTVTAGAYGSASQSLSATVNAQGQLTALSAQAIAIAASQITSGTIASSLISGSYTGITGVGTLTSGTWNATPIANSYLANSAITINGNAVSLGGSTTVTANTPNSLTFNSGGTGDASGTTFNGSAAKTISYNTIGAPSTAGTNATGTWGISVTGNAGTVTNGLYSTGSYSNPTWLTSILGSIVSGAVASATLAASATNVAGGSAGALHYQSGAGATTFLSLGTTNYVLTAGSTAPQYVAQSTLSVGSATTATTATNLAGGAASQIPYQTGSGSTSFIGNGTAGQFLQSNGAAVPTWATPVSYATVTDDTTTVGTRYPLFANQTSGNLATEYTSSTKLQYNPSTGVFTSTSFTGAGTGLTGTASSLSIGGNAATATSATSATTATNIASGANGSVPYQTGSGATTFLAATTNGYIMTLAGGVPTWAAAPATGVTITDDTSSATAYYPLFARVTTGTATTEYTSSTKLNYTPSTGLLASTALSLSTSTLTSSNTSNLAMGGNLSFSDTGIFANFVTTLSGYAQFVLQNKSNNAAASTEFIAYNDAGTASTNFATFGINSSTYTGTGSINAAGYSYFLSGSTDIVVGTIGANSIHLTTNSQTTDAVTINTSNSVAFNGSYGTSGQILQSNGNAAAPTWTTFTGGATITDDTTTNATRYPLFAAATSGTLSTAYTSSTELKWNPSTGTLAAPELIASNGIIENNATISTSYTITTGNNAMSTGPITVSSGVTVTVPSGSNWVIL